MDGFTKREVKEAHLARKAQSVLGHVSNGEMTKLVSNESGITNLPFHTLAVANADAIYGKDLGGVRGNCEKETRASLRGWDCEHP